MMEIFEAGQNRIHFTSEELKRFLRLSLRSAKWVTFKAVAVLAHCGQLKCSQLQLIKWGDMELSELGLRIKCPLQQDGSTFMIPFDDNDVFGCQASKLRKYVVACRAGQQNNEDNSPLVRTFSGKKHMKSGMSVKELKDIPRQIAEVLELPNPERYQDRAFIVDNSSAVDQNMSSDESVASDKSDVDQGQQDLEISNGEYHRRTWREWLRFAKFSGFKKMPVEEDYAKYFRNLKEVQGFSVNLIVRKHSLLNFIHKRKFQTSLLDWPDLKATILGWKAMDEAKKSYSQKQLTRENVLAYFSLDDAQDPEMILIKATMALLYHAKVRVLTIFKVQASQIKKHMDGYNVNVTKPDKFRLKQDISFHIPKGPASMALDQYIALLKTNLGRPIQGQFLKKSMNSTMNLQHAQFMRFPFKVAEKLGLPEPQMYQGTASFYMEERNSPSTSGAVVAKEIRNRLQNLDFNAFPVANVDKIGGNQSSQVKSDYKLSWQTFIAFCQSNAPKEEDYIRYYKYLRVNKNAHSGTLVNKRCGLNFYHSRIFGVSLCSFSQLNELVNQYRAEDRSKGLSGIKKFTQAELEHFFTHQDFNTPMWILLKSAAAIIMSGKLNPKQLTQLQIGDVMLSEEGYWVSYDPDSEGKRVTFLVPFNTAQPALNLAGHIKTYLDSVAKDKQYLDGAFFRRFNHPYGFIEQPLGIWTLRSIGSGVAKALKLENPQFYRNSSFIIDEPAKLGSLYRVKLDPNRQRPNKRKRNPEEDYYSDSVNAQ